MSERRRRREQELEEERQRELERRRRIARARRRRRQIRRRRMMLAGGLAVVAIAVIAGVSIRNKIEKNRELAAIEKQKEEEAAAKREEEQNTLRMVAVGDNLIHDAFIEAGKDNDWNFDFLYENIKQDIKKADLASVNQETPFAESHDSVAGYPDFATPTEVGDALIDAGFDIFTQATEHAFDMESTGVLDTLAYWNKNHEEASVIGIHNSEDEKRYEVIKKKNFKVAVMNYSTVLSQNHSIDEDEEYMVDTYSETRIEDDIQDAKEESDAVIVYLHGGKADSSDPDEKLLERIDFLAEQGADVVICSHPHILKGYEKIKRPDGGEMLVYYSLGNFVSDQSSLENLLGGMAEFILKKNADGGVTIDDYSLTPLVMHYNSDYTECGVYKLSDYTEAMAKEHAIHEEDPEADFTVSDLEDAAEEAGELRLEHGDSAEEDSAGEDSTEEDATKGSTEEDDSSKDADTKEKSEDNKENDNSSDDKSADKGNIYQEDAA